MGKVSVKPNKNIYQISRENAGLTRASAAEKLYISVSRIEKIENGSRPHPDEVLKMSSVYGDHALCNYYCCNCCEIGRDNIPMAESKELSQITLEILSMINSLSGDKQRLIEITVDGKISEDEIADFAEIKNHLEKMSAIIQSLQLWIKKAIDTGDVDKLMKEFTDK